MTDVHGDFERAKVYKVPYGKKKLPPVHNGESDEERIDRAESPHSQTGAEIKQKILLQLQLESTTAQVDRLRVLLREREIETGKLKSENSMLKQVTHISLM